MCSRVLRCNAGLRDNKKNFLFSFYGNLSARLFLVKRNFQFLVTVHEMVNFRFFELISTNEYISNQRVGIRKSGWLINNESIVPGCIVLQYILEREVERMAVVATKSDSQDWSGHYRLSLLNSLVKLYLELLVLLRQLLNTCY